MRRRSYNCRNGSAAGPDIGQLTEDRMTPRIFFSLAAVALTAGCMAPTAGIGPAPQQANLPYNPPIGDAMVPQPAGGSLQERRPDLCGARNYDRFIGQPGAIVPTLGLTRSYRIVEFGGFDQQNYDPNRIVFRLDQTGLIQNVDCG